MENKMIQFTVDDDDIKTLGTLVATRVQVLEATKQTMLNSRVDDCYDEYIQEIEAEQAKINKLGEAICKGVMSGK